MDIHKLAVFSFFLDLESKARTEKKKKSRILFYRSNKKEEHEALMTRFYVTLDICLNGKFYSLLFCSIHLNFHKQFTRMPSASLT